MYYIYRITNKINGKTYIGQHKYKDLNDNYMGSGIHLKRAHKKYGIENFEKEILYSRIQYKETSDSMEIFAIAKERALGKAEYNIADGGQGGNLGEMINKKISEAKKGKKLSPLSEEHRRKISEAEKGKRISDETKRKMSEAMKGKHHSEETKLKLSESHKGKHHSEETRKKMSDVHKGKPSPNKGKSWRMSEEQKLKISAAQKGHRVSDETKRKLSESRKGKHWKLIDGKRVWY